MKRFLVCFAVLTAMVIMIGCGGTDDSNSSHNSSGVCSYGEYECHGNDSYFCGYSGDDLMWIVYEKCENGCNSSTGKCNSGENNENTEPDHICNNGEYKCSGNARLKCQTNNIKYCLYDEDLSEHDKIGCWEHEFEFFTYFPNDSIEFTNSAVETFEISIEPAW